MTGMPTHCAAEERTALYRFYDERETLLYVGITCDPWRRWREHVRDKWWYPQVKHQAVTWYESRPEAEVAEWWAIRREHPNFNIAGAVRPVADEVPASPAPLPAVRRPVPDPGPVPEPDPGPVPEPASEPAESPDPERGIRTLIVITACIAWALLPSALGMPHSSPWGIALLASTVIPVTVFMLIFAAPGVRRLGCWLDRNFGPSLENKE